MNILYAMQDAKYVELNGRTYMTGYRCLPDDIALVPEDVVLEASTEGSDIEITFADVEDAYMVGPDLWLLHSGCILHLYSPPTLH